MFYVSTDNIMVIFFENALKPTSIFSLMEENEARVC